MMTLQHDCRGHLLQAQNADDIASIALAGVISMKSQRCSPYDVPIAGLDDRALLLIAQRHFPSAPTSLFTTKVCVELLGREDEFSDLLNLLLKNRTAHDETSEWLAHAIATASMANNHLWEDMGLPNRTVLSQLMNQYFMPLAARNTGDMRWKKFFYRELCALSGLLLCRSPSCNVCADYSNCFDSEDTPSNNQTSPALRISLFD